jgi:hypothetical protein
MAATVAMVAAGVWAAPHFGYSVREELAYEAAVKNIAAEETPLVERENAQLARWEASGSNGPELAALIDGQLVPYYDRLIQTLNGLVLRPGLATGRRRDVLVRAIQLNLDGLQHLSRGVRQKDADEVAQYRQAESASQAEIAKLKDLK